MTSAYVPITITSLTQYYPSLFQLAGGTRTYALDPSNNDVNPYLPPPIEGTRLRFVRSSSGANQATVRASRRATIAGSETTEMELDNIGDCIVLVAVDGDWQPLNPVTHAA